jgi:hypothetical protein
MRMLFILVAALAVMIAGHNYFFSAQSIIGSPAIVATTLSPHKIRLNYEHMRNLPVHEIPPP